MIGFKNYKEERINQSMLDFKNRIRRANLGIRTKWIRLTMSMENMMKRAYQSKIDKVLVEKYIRNRNKLIILKMIKSKRIWKVNSENNKI